MALPIFTKANDDNFVQMQTQWKSQIDPVLAFPPLKGLLLTNVSLINGVTIIPHKLGRMQQGWIITDVTAGAGIYRTAPLSSTTLTLTSGAACTVNLWCF